MARAAAAAGIPFTLSTMSNRSIEEVAAAAPVGVRWFQLYVQADRGFARSLVQRAEASWYQAIVVTVDLPVLGIRERDRRHGFVLDMPLGNFIGRTDPPIVGRPSQESPGGVSHSSMTWADIETIGSWTTLPIVLKGILTAEDARLAVNHGVAAIVVSNHGARQLDRVVSTLDALEEIVEAVAGRTEIWVDGGVRRGIDIVIARALGAQGVLIGRPFFWALATGGEAGVARALAIIREELEVALALTGTPTLTQIGRAHVR
jgi:4-hydroxymandelate oxidase